MNYLDQAYNPQELETLRRTIHAHLIIGGGRFWLHSRQHAQEFKELLDGFLDAHAPTNTAEFDHVFHLTVLRWRAQWLDLVESEWLAAEGIRFDCHLNRHPRAVHSPNLDLFHEITRQGYPVLYGRIRAYHHEARAHRTPPGTPPEIFGRSTRSRPTAQQSPIHPRLGRPTRRPRRITHKSNQFKGTTMSLETNESKPNRATGPTTPEGKAISSRNSFQHGLYAKYRLFRTEEEKRDHRILLDGFIDSWNPKGEAEYANVHTLAWCQFWRLKLRFQEAGLWISSTQDILDLQKASGQPLNEGIAEVQSLLSHGEREKELARRRRSINGEYNKAYRELTHLQHIRRQEAAAKARQAQEAARVESKSQQETHDRTSTSNDSPQSTGEFVSANPETPPETDL